MGLLRLSTVDRIVDYTTKLIIIHHLIHQQPRPTSRGWRFAEAHSITPTSQWKPWSRTVIKSPPFTKFCLLSPLSSVVDMSLQPSVPPFRSIALSLYTNSWLLLLLFTLSSVQPLSCFQLFVTPWTAVHQVSLSITNPQSLLKLMSIESVMPSNHLILCRPLLLPPSIFSSIRIFSSESVLCIRWPKYWSLSFSISPSNEYSGLIFFRMDWLDLLAVQGTLKNLL